MKTLGEMNLLKDDQETQRDCHEMQVIATNGHRFFINPEAVLRVVTSKYYAATIVIFCALIALVDAPLFNLSIGLGSRFAVWLATCIFVTTYWMAFFKIHQCLCTRFGLRIPILNPIVNCSGIAIAIWLQYWASVTIFGIDARPPIEVWYEVLRYSAVATLVDIISVWVVMPKIEGVRFPGQRTNEAEPAIAVDQGTIPPEPKPQPPRKVTVRNLSIAADSLLYLKSVEHYVEFVTDSETHLERASLKEVLEQVETLDGIQTHRSYWVHRRAVASLQRQNGNSVVRLLDGTDIPVARSRRDEVELWWNPTVD